MVRFTLNGAPREALSAPDTPLLWVIREELGLTGTKYGCGIQMCGACRVLVDGAIAASCGTLLSEVEGKAITTIEGNTGRVAEAVFAAWEAHQVAQCGYCQPGQVMAATALLMKTPRPTDAEIDADEAMGRNVCRCATYMRIRAAVHTAAKTLEG